MNSAIGGIVDAIFDGTQLCPGLAENILMGLPALRYPVLIPQTGASGIRHVESARPIETAHMADVGGSGNAYWSGDDSEVEIIDLPSPEMAHLLAQARPSIDPGRLRRFEELQVEHMQNSYAACARTADQVLSSPDLQDEILRNAREIVGEMIVNAALNLVEFVGPEHADELETRIQESLDRMKRAEVRFVDQSAETSPIPPGAAGLCQRSVDGGTTIWVGVSRASTQSVLEIVIHELLHAAEAEKAISTPQGDVFPTWFKVALAKGLLSTEKLSLLEFGPKTQADFENLNSVFGSGNIMSSEMSPVQFFQKRIENWHEVLIDSLALAGLNFFISNTPAGTSPELTFGAGQMVAPYENFPVPEEEFAASLGVRGYSIGHVLHAEAWQIVSRLGPDVPETLQRLGSLAYGAMFFATPENARSGDESSALEVHFLRSLEQAVGDLGEIRFLFFLSMLAISSAELPTRDIVSLN